MCVLNVGTVPTFSVLNVGTVPTLCILNIGTVPTFKHSLKGNKNVFGAKMAIRQSPKGVFEKNENVLKTAPSSQFLYLFC